MGRPKGSKQTESAKLKIAESGRGRKHSAESRQKMSDARKGKASRKGFHWSEETKRKMSEAQQGERNHNWGLGGEKSASWKGGLTPIVRSIRSSVRYRQWRVAVLTRDNFTCQLCSIRGGRLQVDHYPKRFAQIVYDNQIRSFAEAMQSDGLWDIDNGRSLCEPCHKATPTYLRRYPR